MSSHDLARPGSRAMNHVLHRGGTRHTLALTLVAGAAVASFGFATVPAVAQSAGAQPDPNSILLGLPPLIATILAQGPDAIGYEYDALGRLVRVNRTGAATNGVNSAYAYDQADNRAQRWTGSGAPPPAPPLRSPFFSVGDAPAVREGDALVFTVTKSGSANTSYSVNWSTATGSALAGSDFQPASGTLVFGPGEYAKVVSIATVDDTAYEPSKAMYLDLSGASGGAVISGARGTGVVNSEDLQPNPPPASQAPTPANDSASTARCGDGITVNVLANDTDPDGNYPLNLSAIEYVSSGTATVESPTSIFFQPNPSTTGNTAQVRYVVVDATGVTARATLGMTLTGPSFCQ